MAWMSSAAIDVAVPRRIRRPPEGAAWTTPRPQRHLLEFAAPPPRRMRAARAGWRFLRLDKRKEAAIQLPACSTNGARRQLSTPDTLTPC